MLANRPKGKDALLKSVPTQRPPGLSRGKTEQRERVKVIKEIHA
jgi:hypothetical protein